jgi:glutathione S-transferase
MLISTQCVRHTPAAPVVPPLRFTAAPRVSPEPHTTEEIPMKLYYAETLNPRKVCAVARYLSLPVEFARVDLSKGENRTATFLALNPNGKVPVLETAGRTLWEANAIMCYLARVAQSDLWPDDERQIDVIRWFNWNSEHFSRFAGRLYFEHLIKSALGLGGPDAAAVEEANDYVRKYGAVLNAHLRERKYLVDDRLTVADFAVAATLPYANQARLPLDGFAEIERWYAQLAALPAWRDPFPLANRTA